MSPTPELPGTSGMGCPTSAPSCPLCLLSQATHCLPQPCLLVILAFALGNAVQNSTPPPPLPNSIQQSPGPIWAHGAPPGDRSEEVPNPFGQVEPLLVPIPEELQACPDSVDSKATPLGGGQQLCFFHLEKERGSPVRMRINKTVPVHTEVQALQKYLGEEEEVLHSY